MYAALALAVLCAPDPPLVPVTGGLPATVTATIAGVDHVLPCTVIVTGDPDRDAAHLAQWGYTWTRTYADGLSVRVSYSGGGFPGAMVVSVNRVTVVPLAHYEGGAPQAAASWDVTLQGAPGTCRVKAN
jgi:hypothetical protein